MTEQQRRFRSEKKPPIKGKGDRILNYLITIVVILIIVVAGFIFSGNDEKKVAVDNPNEVIKEQPKEKEQEKEQEKPKKSDHTTEEKIEDQSTKSDENLTGIEKLKASDTAKVTVVDNAEVLESIEDESWQPYKTKQTTNIGEDHVSVYNDSSPDWDEKVLAISDITGLAVDNMTVWHIKNNNGVSKSIGMVSSKDEKEKYRVAIVWVPNEGWKAEKVEVLKEINGAY